MVEEENQADESPPPPTESDVCFGDKDHPGTQHFVQVVEQIATFSWVETGYSPEVYHAINTVLELKHRRFFFHSKKQGKWVVATKKKKNREFQKAFEMQREKLSEETDKALKSRVSVEDVVDLEKGEPNVIQDVVDLEENPPTKAPTASTPVCVKPPIRASTASTAATDEPAGTNLFLSILGGICIVLYFFLGFSPIFLGVFWTWVAFGILHLLRLVCDENLRSANAFCTCCKIYGVTIAIIFGLSFIMVEYGVAIGIIFVLFAILVATQ